MWDSACKKKSLFRCGEGKVTSPSKTEGKILETDLVIFLENKRFFWGVSNKNGGGQKQKTRSQVLDTAHVTLEEKVSFSVHLNLTIRAAESHLSDCLLIQTP